MPNAAAEPLISRFRGDVARIAGDDAVLNARFGIAVSGGPDSMALLWLAARSFPGRVFAATVDHQLRSQARDEAEMVSQYCAGTGITHIILTPCEPIGGNIQSAARSARYALLRQWCEDEGIDWLITAHHADDQMETLLMRLNRASGVDGLAGVRARNGQVLRPLIGWRRAELAAIVATENLPHVLDPSNEDMRFDRVAMREHLKAVDWLDPLAFSRSAEALADASLALDWMVESLAARHVKHRSDDSITLETHEFPAEIQRRLLLHMLALAEPGRAPPRGASLDQALVQLLQGKKAMIGDWLLIGGDSWTIKRAPPRTLV